MKNPLFQYTSRYRVHRGGSWVGRASFTRVSSRNWDGARRPRSYLGLRLVRTSERS